MPFDNLLANAAYADLSILVNVVSTGAVAVVLFLTKASNTSLISCGKLVLSFAKLYSA